MNDLPLSIVGLMLLDTEARPDFTLKDTSAPWAYVLGWRLPGGAGWLVCLGSLEEESFDHCAGDLRLEGGRWLARARELFGKAAETMSPAGEDADATQGGILPCP